MSWQLPAINENLDPEQLSCFALLSMDATSDSGIETL